MAQPLTQNREHLSPLREDLQELSKATQRIAEDSLDQVKKGFKNYYERGQEKFTQMGDKMEETMRFHPLVTLFAAAGVGFLLGWLRKRVWHARREE